MQRIITFIALVLLGAGTAHATADRVAVSGTQPAFADIAKQIGGSLVVSAPLGAGTSPDMILMEGGPYDAWVAPRAKGLPARTAVLHAKNVADHSSEFTWYDPQSMIFFGQKIARELAARLPAHADEIQARETAFEKSMQDVQARASAVGQMYRGSNVLLADVRYSPLIRLLKLDDVTHGEKQSEVDLLRAIHSHKGMILIYGARGKLGLSETLKDAAQEAGIPMVGLQEEEPAALNYQQWMNRSISTIRGALNEASP